MIVPYRVAGKKSVQVVAGWNGLKGAPASLNITTAAPCLFSLDFSGKNLVAALNEDGSFNTAAAAAEIGKLIVLPLPEFLAPLTVEIGGVAAEVLYAGPVSAGAGA